jgi:Tol biopolymer transport system component
VGRTPAVAPSAALRFTQESPAGTRIVSGGVLSPNGLYLAFAAEDLVSGVAHLWVRALNSEEPRVLPGTEGAFRPFWAPDSQSLGFAANGRLKSVALNGDSPRTLAAVRSYTPGAAWGADQILFSNWRGGLESIAPLGGLVSPMTLLDTSAAESGHKWPSFLPDYKHYLFHIASTRADRAGIYVGMLNSPERRRLLDGSHLAAVYAAPGYLVYMRTDGTLLAQAFDANRVALSGDPVVLADNVSAPSFRNGATLSAAGGLLAYGGGPRSSTLMWFNRHGERLGTINSPTSLHNPAFCSNEKELMAMSFESERSNVWVVDLERGVTNRLVSDASMPMPSPDGHALAFGADRSGIMDVYLRRRNTRRVDEEPLIRTNESKYVNDWSSDGRYIVFQSSNAKTGADLWTLPTFGDRKAVPYLRTEFEEIQSRISPDGRWLAYTSDESGEWEVYVQSFPSPAARQVISVRGGAEPVWRHDGRELYYLAADRALMAVDVSTAGETLRVSRPRVLFRPPVAGALNDYRSHYAVTRDGERFVIDGIDAESTSRPITILSNWTALLPH